MKQKLIENINNNFSFLKQSKLLLAVSGGIDSMVMVNLFHNLKYNISVAHCNFQLRDAESDGDEFFVKSYCEKYNIPFFIQKFDTIRFSEDHKLSIQLAARKIRYSWFDELMKVNNIDYLLTAHHLDDSLETFLINFTRGSGLDGLIGIPEQNNKIVRPLLPFTRKEIIEFARDNNIEWREDSSNISNKYLRNKLRHDVIPVLKELNPNFLGSFENTIEHLKQAQSLVDDASRIVYRKIVEDIDLQKKINLNQLLQLQNYKAYLYQWLQPFGFLAWEDIYDLVHAQSGKQIFSENYTLLKDRDFLIVYPSNTNVIDEVYFIEKDQKQVKVPINISLNREFNPLLKSSNCIFVDEDLLSFPLEIRKWREGDVIYPSGMIGKKKLSKFFKDEKYSLIDKSNTWLLCSDNQIVWVIGKRQDRRFEIKNATTNIIQIKVN